MKVSVFLPCRKGSQRVKNKNMRVFGDFQNGLLEIKLKHLIKSQMIDKIYLSSNDENVLNYAKSLKHANIILDKRSDSLASDKVSADDLIMYAYNLIQEGEILWTHVTSPFFTHVDYDCAIARYMKALNEGYDSLMSVTPMQGFFWDKSGSLNYDIKLKKWPATQETGVIYELNSAVFLTNAKVYKEMRNRIGIKPFLFETNKIKGFDIDWEEDFLMAEALLKTDGQIIGNELEWGD
ncbi:hypothetical protein ACNVGH_001262 [Campylobacter coli]